MGSILPSLIQIIADSVGITALSDEAAKVLAPDAEYHVREIVQVSPPPPPLRGPCTHAQTYTPPVILHAISSKAQGPEAGCRNV